MAQRKFKCSDCVHEWKVPFGTGQCGANMECPACHSRNIHKIDRGGHGLGNRGQGRRGGCKTP